MGPNDRSKLPYIKLNRLRDARELPLAPPEPEAAPPLGSWTSNWILEVLSCVLSLGFLVAIIVVLASYDGKPIPDWPCGITLNALVSVLSTFMKAAMAFAVTEGLSQLKWSWFTRRKNLGDMALLDAASRGPLGAAMVLFRFLPRHLVTFGCVILVVAVATDPFVQQVIAINEQAIHTPGRSSIQICNSSLYTDVGAGAAPGAEKVPLVTLGAIYTGIFQSQSPDSKTIVMDCASGNCTFSPYQSLGFCSRCINITDSVHADAPYSLPPPLNATLVYNYTLPNGLHFSTNSGMTMTTINTSTELDLVQLDAQNLPLIINFTAISATGYKVPPPITATECALYFCVDTYNASVKNGQFEETRTLTTSKTNYLLSKSGGQDSALTPDTCYVNGTRHQPPYQANENCTYNVAWQSLLAMYNSVGPLLQGNGYTFGGRPAWRSDNGPSDIIEALYGESGGYADINSLFKSLASSLTTHARSKVCDGTIDGVAWTNQSFVHVRWPWMSLPIALVVLTIVFLIVTVIRTRHQYIWKSSPLALLFSDVHVDEPLPFKSDPTLKGMESASNDMHVCLEASSNGVSLKTHPSS
ncbi:hypothetical protein PCG10_002689 [Penicillium crustosum]|uniref:Uncharacterized protein n=1 Tax=Penicillium crustosum TaxID=36656 RepID=A0A9P5GBL7_PENCR|nr:hypothetical protein PCG10_002689 [Penicillium crustosum]